MNQEKIDTLAKEHYFPRYAHHSQKDEIKAEVAKIVEEEKAKGNDPLTFSRGVRTRISVLLQSHIPVVDPPIATSTNIGELRNSLDNHHNHQTAHFQAIWQHVDSLAREAGVKLEGDL